MKRWTEARPQGARRGGFTLLEVLAAVAILGIWFSVLASIAIQGQRSEGENERRARASLIADRALLELELGFAQNDFPGESVDQFEEDEFLIEVESMPLANLDLVDMDEAFVALLQGDLAGLTVDFQAVRVNVKWTEGHEEKSVTRLTYAWDSTRLAEALEKADAENGGAGGSQGGDGDEGGLGELGGRSP